MLQIKLNKGSSSETGGGAKPSPGETVTVACPDHLVLADLPVGKSLGVPPAALLVKTVGRKSRRPLGERVHFCVRCDFPINIYGRLSPCDHAFCLDCARIESMCYLCDERIQKIQTIKLMEGIFICAAPHCLVSFLSKSEFESHINEKHADLLHPNNTENGEDIEMEDVTAKQQSSVAVSDSSVRAPPPKLPFSPTAAGSSSQGNDRRPPMMQQPPRPPHPFFGQQPPIHQSFQMPMNPNQVMTAPPPFGVQPFYGGTPPYDMGRSGLGPQEQGSLLGFPSNAANFQENYPRPWNMGQPVAPFDPSAANMAPPLPPLQQPMMQPHMSQSYPGGEMGNDAQGFGWQFDKRDNFGNHQNSQ